MVCAVGRRGVGAARRDNVHETQGRPKKRPFSYLLRPDEKSQPLGTLFACLPAESQRSSRRQAGGRTLHRARFSRFLWSRVQAVGARASTLIVLHVIAEHDSPYFRNRRGAVQTSGRVAIISSLRGPA